MHEAAPRSWFARVMDVALGRRRAPRLEAEDVGGHAPIGESGLTSPARIYSRVSVDNEDSGSDFPDMASWVRTARAMLRTDGTLAGAWRYIAHRQLGALDLARWEPSVDDFEGRRNAEFLNENFGLGKYKGRGRLRKGLRRQLHQVLMWQAIGAVLLEEVDHEAPDAAGVPRFWLSSYEPRSLTRLDSWLPSDDGTQMTAAMMRRHDGSLYRLPIHEDPEHPGRGSLYIVADVEGGDPDGRMGGLLRAAYGAYRLKREALDQLGLGLYRWATEIPVGSIDYAAARAADMSEARIREARAAMVEALQAMRSIDEAYAVDSDVASVRPFGARFDPSPLGQIMEALGREMLASMFMQAMSLGTQSGGVGSYNAATVHHDGALQIYANLAEETAEAISLQTGRRLIRLNFGESSPPPRLVLPGVRRDPLPDMAGLLIQAHQAGLVQAAPDIAEAFRVASGLSATPPRVPATAPQPRQEPVQ